ncbi:class A beta-lactamase-related serine hydrolase [Aureibaculum marinum]|uniref:Class A beta-lactamase-related serine hydrolase n=1 Tax=Aureibaculum marinum TaxID=2487930 RepID=A0A3N4ND08_9FLAO|nr:serine hydrolase domain-containing protein [Aureibaculum marinum]RPD93235.1 class A beta-lactamase-related serine hydrolase [Aureibaculum marinum]
MKLFKILFTITFILLIFSCKKNKKETKHDTTLNINELNTYFTKAMPTNEPGGSILIMKGDSIIFSKGYGLADLELKTKIDKNTLFNIGSISKTFVSNAILILQEEGKLSIEDNMAKYFPDFKNKAIAEKVKIKHLLTHTSGLKDNRQTKKDSIFYLSAKDAENWYPTTQAQNLNFEPGTRYEYSNPAYNALALIIEQVAGIKWQKYIEDKIFKPSGMKNSTITDGPHPETGVSHGYIKSNGHWIEKDYGEEPTFAASGNGGVWSSVNELANYELALQQHKFISDSTFKDSRTIKSWPNWKDSTPPFIGWSWFIRKTTEGLKTVGHEGSQGGFLCNYVTIPDKKITFIILCNTRRDVDGFTEFITKWLTKNHWLKELE